MSYNPPFIGTQGLVLPSYQDIRDALVESYLAAYAQTAYTKIDAADYQWISAVALKVSDTLGAIQLLYNGRSPATAVYADLDALVKLNGLARKPASYSTAALLITGTPRAVITSGAATDQNQYTWNLPTPITIPAGGTIVVQATASAAGAIEAPANTINLKATPTSGWIGVTNPSPAVPGTAVERDSQLRARQAISVALPSRTMLAGTIAAIAAVAGVTRYNVLENPTSAVDGYGNPPHSVTAVVEGGLDLEVATAIYNNRGIGCATNGTTTVNVADPTNPGLVMPIGFFRPTDVPVYTTLQLHGLNAGFTSSIQDAIKAAVATYQNSLQIGEALTVGALYAAALSVTPNLSLPLFSIRSLTVGTDPGSQAPNDVTVTFNQVVTGAAANVTITLV